MSEELRCTRTDVPFTGITSGHSDSEELYGKRVSSKIVIIAFFITAFMMITAYVFLGADVGYVLRDPASTTGASAYLGAISSIGVIGWTIAAAISIFCGLACRDLDGKFSSFLIFAGAFTAIVGLDDLFLLHESIVYIGITDKVFLVAYAILAVGLRVFFADCLFSRGRILPVAVVAAFGISLVTDALSDFILYDASAQLDTYRLMIEDGFKLLGIMLWASFLVLQSHALIRRSLRASL